MPRKRYSKLAAAQQSVQSYIDSLGEEFRRDLDFWDALVNEESAEPSDARGKTDDFNVIPAAPDPAAGPSPITKGQRDDIIMRDHLRRCLRNPSVFSFVLQSWLYRTSIPVPKDVFQLNFFSKRPGRPRTDDEVLCAALLAYKTHKSYSKAARELDPEAFARDAKGATDRLRHRIGSIRMPEDEPAP